MIRQSTRYTSPASQLLRPATWVLPLCLLAGGLVASAGDPAPGQRQPTTNPTTRQDRSGGDNQRGWREPTAEEWDAAVLFLKEHNPRRLAIYEEAVASWRKSQGEVVDPEAELPRNIRGARARIYTRVHFLRMLEEHDPELYEFALGQFRLEDQVIGHLQDARDAEKAGDEDAMASALEAADEAVRAYAEGTLKERKDRIERMRRELNREEERLEQDRTNFDRLVERLKERFERSLPGRSRDGDRDGNRGDRERDGEREESQDGRGEESGG